ncbi:thioredoxin family protein [Stakelama sediminis]|uniref:Thiol:disulfide interchange protein/DsbC/DsbD-like thiol-disulfide interchange protein n=1 Tax=Stakelama sediminis TaxID=463200 RepID=A0A840YV39_9SPHN|nr:thiol:disulfide interchange protein/DsbC/DsbD-like thiol-disulfide interchange protein [Stakelama sediminis]
MRHLRFVLMTVMAALLSALALPAAAQTLGNSDHIAIRLVPETDSPAPGGTVTLAFVSTPEKGWHGYWQNPGDAGVKTTADWTLPAGVKAGPLRYPIPQRLMLAGIMNYVFEGPFTQFADLTIPADAKAGTRLPIRVKLDYLVCTHEICVPETKTLTTALTVGDGGISPQIRAQFDQWRQALPRPLGSAAHYAVAGKSLRIAIPFPQSMKVDPANAYFFPVTDGAISYADPQKLVRDGDTLIVETGAGSDPKGTIQGVLKLGSDTGFLVSATPGAVPVPSTATTQSGWLWSSALAAFFGAVLGGLILNIMPCVFPILSLKALSLARSGETEHAARAEALAYTAGVVLVCVALGGILLALRAAGATAGWAFQLQDPRVILFLLLLVTGIALNLAGLFELSAPGVVNKAAARGTGGAFATGALAAFIATPCTGPFMGVALGAALVLPWPLALAIFAGLGLGLALPFLAIGFIPALRARLPKPGSWMETFRHILSVPMFLTALALAWVLGRQAGVNGMTLGLAAALLAAFGLWWTGRRQSRGKSAAWLPAALAVLIALGGIALVERAPAQAETAAMPLDAQPFTEARLQELRASGRPVFAYFTADWCLTCKVNEKTAIDTSEVARAFKQNNVAVLVGDWTDGDPTLGRFIEAHNRAGVPLYLWYAPGADSPRILPQILTPAMLAALPERHGAGT